MKCQHPRTKTGPDRPFLAPVYDPPYTHEEQRAWGGVVYSETCLTCGASRDVASNGMFQEYGTWRS